MKIFTELINLFFVPVITVYILYNQELIFDKIKLLMSYAIAVVVNTIVADVMGVFLFKYTGLDFSKDGSKYGIMAIIIAIIIAYVLKTLKTYVKLNLVITKTKRDSNEK